jgi:hypothetical protein
MILTASSARLSISVLSATDLFCVGGMFAIFCSVGLSAHECIC